jgi:hypothetical protein
MRRHWENARKISAEGEHVMVDPNGPLAEGFGPNTASAALLRPCPMVSAGLHGRAPGAIGAATHTRGSAPAALPYPSAACRIRRIRRENEYAAFPVNCRIFVTMLRGNDTHSLLLFSIIAVRRIDLDQGQRSAWSLKRSNMFRRIPTDYHPGRRFGRTA